MAAKKSPSFEKHFSFPRFDRRAFLAKEVRDAKVSFLSLGLAALMALISLLLAHFVHVGPALVVGFVGPGSLYYLLPRANIDTSEFERKNWAGPALITFFAWLGLFILLSNPPFQDLSAPKLQDFRLYELGDSEFELVERGDDGYHLDHNSTNLFFIRAIDNWEVKWVRLDIYQGSTRQHNWTLQVYDPTLLDPRYNASYGQRYAGHYYYVEVPPETLSTGEHHLEFVSQDTKGNERLYPADFTVD